MIKTTRARYTLEFKQEAARLVEGGQRQAAVAKTLGLVEQTLFNWVKASRPARGGRQQAGEPPWKLWGARSLPSGCNACSETLFGSLKVARLHEQQRFVTRRHAKDETLAWLLWYNQSRLHSTPNYVSPMPFEKHWQADQATQASS